MMLLSKPAVLFAACVASFKTCMLHSSEQTYAQQVVPLTVHAAKQLCYLL